LLARPLARPPRRQVLCVNNGLGMGKGKVGAQCAHAAVGIVGKYFRSREVALRQWEMCGQARRGAALPACAPPPLFYAR